MGNRIRKRLNNVYIAVEHLLIHPKQKGKDSKQGQKAAGVDNLSMSLDLVCDLKWDETARTG